MLFVGLRKRRRAEIGVAMADLGYCYERGFGKEKDQAAAVAWYRKAAQNGHAGGMTNLGWCYESGMGVAQDWAESCTLVF